MCWNVFRSMDNIFAVVSCTVADDWKAFSDEIVQFCDSVSLFERLRRCNMTVVKFMFGHADKSKKHVLETWKRTLIGLEMIFPYISHRGYGPDIYSSFILDYFTKITYK